MLPLLHLLPICYKKISFLETRRPTQLLSLFNKLLSRHLSCLFPILHYHLLWKRTLQAWVLVLFCLKSVILLLIFQRNYLLACNDNMHTFGNSMPSLKRLRSFVITWLAIISLSALTIVALNISLVKSYRHRSKNHFFLNY